MLYQMGVCGQTAGMLTRGLVEQYILATRRRGSMTIGVCKAVAFTAVVLAATGCIHYLAPVQLPVDPENPHCTSGLHPQSNWRAAEIPGWHVRLQVPQVGYSLSYQDSTLSVWTRRDNGVGLLVSRAGSPDRLYESSFVPKVIDCLVVDFPTATVVQVAVRAGDSYSSQHLEAVGWWPAPDSVYIRVFGRAATVGDFNELMAILETLEVLDWVAPVGAEPSPSP